MAYRLWNPRYAGRTNTIRTWKGDDRSIDSSMNLIGDGRSEPRQSSPHRTAVKFVYLNSELLIRLGLARLSATACLTVCSFFPLFPSSTRSWRIQKGKAYISHTSIAQNLSCQPRKHGVHLGTATFPLSFRFWKSHVSFLQSCRLRWPSLSYVSRLPVWPVSKLHHARLSQKSEPGLYSSRILRTHMRLWILGVAVPECSDQEKHNMITYPCAKKYSAVNLQSFSLTLNQHQPPATN